MWPDSEETAKLLDEARNGEADAVDRLLGRHRDALRRMVEARLDRAIAARLDASDIIQEALLEASRRLQDYLREPKMPFHLWIRHIARDRIIDAHRRHRAAARRSVERERPLAPSPFSSQSSIQLMSQLAAPGLTPAAAAIRRELEERFQTALETLEEDDREVILMRHQEGLSNQDAAQALELSEPAASMRYLRALRRLRVRLAEDGTSGE